ncbi:BrnA antitoxin family protein [uncultured Gilvimarinus sp.]|uniref:BrnA antitoxin family protein n=1 Tax=uncultured Gilvimarinus sp. TaxID=1689143 RepID=UPI0030EF7874|tara:strand:- start:387 stop:671 length:285 start_codon:yes stop_codon:yes gene_type:complete
MSKQPNPEMIDHDNPEWTEAEFARARPASDVLPEIFPKKLAAQMLKPKTRGPQKAPTKAQVSLRLSEVVLTHYRSTGKGWQTRLDNDLKKLHHL